MRVESAFFLMYILRLADERKCKGNTNEDFDACDEADNSNGQN